ncbi:MAG TPA: alpha-L-arabinofuranosidase C-terminal domain-containing protein [Planctomycetota bacterium]|nr:alpha-L-arabinofuranosidase C-terminal domain-containing protein [Planctomycetota bacterium]
MHAQILRNPTFADFPFAGGGNAPDGGVKFQCDEAVIDAQILKTAQRLGWPAPARLVEARRDALAMFWIKEGPREAVRTSPDAAPHQGRAQRVEASAAGQGLAQWIHLPLHRVGHYDFRMVARSPDLRSLRVACADRAGRTVARVEVRGVNRVWGSFSVKLRLKSGATARPGGPYRLTITAPERGQFVIARALLYPADHVRGADPDVIRLLRESRLPLLRWPGGNFVSGYHWEDGIGPTDERPTRANPAWGGLEPNLFGTHEFIAFCRAVGCEPMICVNAGIGTPEEAARWVAYCNGSARTPQGRRRARHGATRPFRVRHWEIGNELSGSHQIGWTTAAGYADRYREFARAMRAADPTIRIIACGSQGEWNARLFRGNAGTVDCVSDHILEGGPIQGSTDPLTVFRDFMAFPTYYEEEFYARWREAMRKAGIRSPRLAITELQLFGRILQSGDGRKQRLTPEYLVTPTTWAEAAYCTLFYHLAVRMNPFVELITHSATVNHGGGLRKTAERVYANPCHHAQRMFSAFNGATPVPVELRSPDYETAGVIKRLPAGMKVPALDVVAATQGQSLLVSAVNRGTGPVRLALDVSAFRAHGELTMITLAAKRPWNGNTPERLEAVAPRTRTVHLRGGRVDLPLPPFTLAVLQAP